MSIPASVARFVEEHLDSVAALEALVLLHSAEDRKWSHAEVAARIYVSPAMAAAVLGDLAEHGLLQRDDGSPPAFRYGPATEELGLSVGQLMETYARELIPLTKLIHARQAPELRQFAEAFRLRKG